MTGPHYLQQPWRLRLYWFSEIQFCFLACGWFLVTAEGEEKSLEECVCVCVCGWQLSITCQWDESHPLERRHIGERQGGGGLLFLPYLSLSFTASLCLLVWFALPPTFYSPYTLLRLTWITLVIELTLDFKRSLPGTRMCSSLLFAIFQIYFSLIIPMPSIHLSLPQAQKMNFVQSAIYSVNMRQCMSLFTFSPVCQNSLKSDRHCREGIKVSGLLQVKKTLSQTRRRFFPLVSKCSVSITFIAAHAAAMCLFAC